MNHHRAQGGGEQKACPNAVFRPKLYISVVYKFQKEMKVQVNRSKRMHDDGGKRKINYSPSYKVQK